MLLSPTIIFIKKTLKHAKNISWETFLLICKGRAKLWQLFWSWFELVAA